MGHREVAGRTKAQLQDLRDDYDGDEPFDERYCLAKIPNQPEDYDGPVRFCINRETYGKSERCKFHGGKTDPTPRPENLDKLAAMKHGMTATREHLVEDFDEKDQALYDWIVDSFPEAYGIDVEEDPQATYDLHRLAAEIVRAERGRGYLIQEGEVSEVEVRDDDGRLVIDENGEVVTKKSQHYLADMLKDQDNKITKLERELGISRKERLKRDGNEDAVEVIAQGFSELGRGLLDREDTDYDPDEKPWEEDDNEQDN